MYILCNGTHDRNERKRTHTHKSMKLTNWWTLCKHFTKAINFSAFHINCFVIAKQSTVSTIAYMDCVCVYMVFRIYWHWANGTEMSTIFSFSSIMIMTSYKCCSCPSVRSNLSLSFSPFLSYPFWLFRAIRDKLRFITLSLAFSIWNRHEIAVCFVCSLW